MRIWQKFWSLALTGLVAAGCGSSNNAETKSPPSSPLSAAGQKSTNATPQSSEPAPQGKPQPKLRTVKLWLGPEQLETEVAITMPEIETGEMFRTNITDADGMIFVFRGPHQASFWMRNTLVPLSCAYIDPDGVILEIHDMKPLDETPIKAATPRVQYVLEVKQGWFDRHKVAVGMTVRSERGTLSETFFGRQ